MKKFIILLIPCILFSQVNDTIFKTKLIGIQVQSFDPDPTASLVKFYEFTTYQSGEWYILQAKAYIPGGSSSGDIISIKLSGIEIQGTTPLPSGEYFNGFSISGPDVNGFVTLSVNTTLGNSYQILRTKLGGTMIESYTNPLSQIRRFIGGITADGIWAYLRCEINSPLGENDFPPGREKGWDGKGLNLNYALKEISPNPAREFTRISFTIPREEHVKIYVYDKTGKLVKKIVDEKKPRGLYRIFWGLVDEDNRLLPNGEYFIKMEAGKFKKTEKLLILK